MKKFDLEAFPTSESAKRMLSYVSNGFYDQSYVGKWLFQVMGLEYDEALKLVEELPYQFFPETATWGLFYHEIKWQIPVRKDLSYDERRKFIYQKRDTRAPMTPYAMEQYLSNVTDFEVHISDVNDRGVYGFVPTHPNIFQATFIGEGTLEIEQVRIALRKIKQSHTEFIVAEYIDVLLPLFIFYETKLYFASECYPRRNVPYLYYDGTIQYNGLYRYDKYKIGSKIDFYPVALSMQHDYPIPIQYDWGINLKGIVTWLPICERVEKLTYLFERVQRIRIEEALAMKMEVKKPYRFKVDLTVGYHLSKYDGTHRYNGTRRYDSRIIHYEDI